MDLLLMPDYIMDPQGLLDGVDSWPPVRQLGKRKHWPHDEVAPLAKMTKQNGEQNWEQVEELAADLDGSCSLSSLNVDLASSAFQNRKLSRSVNIGMDICYSDALLSLPSLSAFKQELLSPFNSNDTGGDTNGHTSPQRHKQIHHCYDQGMNGNVDYQVGLNSPGQSDGSNSGGNLVVNQSPNPSIVPLQTDCRFQYVLAAATSIATKVNEETLTYLNQGQSYEIKLKKLGDLSEYRGKVLKSVVRLVFHERRLQYMEREQLAAWEASHPGDSILEVDLPLSYGLIELTQDPTRLNTIEFLWDPTKEVGIYIKVNCISTEFTPKKHGGEKGVPFRIQVETYLQSEQAIRHLHTASCQVKVFKLKGADRKHKQDREKIQKRPPLEQEKYQCSYDCTILTDVPINGDNAFPPLLLNTPNIAPVSNPEMAKLRQVSPVAAKEESPPGSQKPNLNNSCNSSIQKYDESVSASWGPQETSVWLQTNRYGSHIHTLSTYSGSDLLRLSKENLTQLCGLPDGIRLYNALHSRTIAPRLTVYLCLDIVSKVYQAVYLGVLTSGELQCKVASLLGVSPHHLSAIYLQGPNAIRVIVSDELVSHITDQSTFTVEILSHDAPTDRYQVLLKQTNAQAPT